MASSRPPLVVRVKRRSPPPPEKPIRMKVPEAAFVPGEDAFRRARLILKQAGMLAERNGLDFVEGVAGAAGSLDLLRAANRLLRSEGKPLLGKNHWKWE